MALPSSSKKIVTTKTHHNLFPILDQHHRLVLAVHASRTMYSLGIFGSCVAKIFFAPISHTKLCSFPVLVITSKEMPASAGVRDAGGAAPGPQKRARTTTDRTTTARTTTARTTTTRSTWGAALAFFADMGPRVGEETRASFPLSSPVFCESVFEGHLLFLRYIRVYRCTAPFRI